MRTKTYFITDAHLGSGPDSRQRERDMVAWLDAIALDACRVVMLGDIFDFWFSYKHVVPRGFVRLLGKMAQMVDDGVEFHFFIGNHDMWMFDYLEKEVGVVMHNEPLTVEWDGKLFLLGHGDGMDPKDHSYNLMKRIFRCPLNQWLFAGIHPKIGFSIAQSWSDSSRKSHNKLHNTYLGDDREGIAQYCLAQQRARRTKGLTPYDYYLFGHRHTPVRRELDGGIYVNVGNWIEHRDYAMFDSTSLVLTEWNPQKRQ
ncbi:MAG: UDP-2,3-diacylglucosamine diphosphatase [Bacteroidales bacterium]|nr:UDP-2,3-diacylglucosamine diphosphatase [Bacteroidales bacterium]